MEEESSDEEMDEDEPSAAGSSSSALTSIFTIISPPPSSALRTTLTGISNLAALRFFNDVDVVHAPKPVEGTARVRPGNRLMDLDGFAEAYSGNLVWIYDSQSNADRSVRLVSQRPASYGSATCVAHDSRII